MRKNVQDDHICVLQVFSCLNRGGAESRVMDIYRSLDRSKIQFDFLVTTPEPDSQFFASEIRQLGGTIHEIVSVRRIGILGYFSQWKRILKSKRYSIVHSHMCLESGIPLFFAWLNGVEKRIAHARSSSVYPRTLGKRVYYKVVRALTNIFSNVKLYCSKEAATFVFGEKRLQSGKLHYMPNAINLTKYSRIPAEELRLLNEELGLTQAGAIIGTVGNARIEKNHIFLVKVFHRLLKEVPDAKLLLIGDCVHDEEAKEYVELNSLWENVSFLGKRNDVPTLLQLLDAFLLPSISEGAPGVVIEAQAANVPCVLSENITREVDVGAGLVTYLSLDDSLDAWVSEILNSLKHNDSSLEYVHDRIRSCGFDVLTASKQLEGIYRSRLQE